MDNLEQLIESVAKEVMRRLTLASRQKIMVLGTEEQAAISSCLQQEFDVQLQPTLEGLAQYDYVVVPASYLANTAAQPQRCTPPAAVLDLSQHKLIHESTLRELCTTDGTTVQIAPKAIVTQLAADYLKKRKATVVRLD